MHRPQFIAARDSRNRRIASLCTRNGRYYAILWADRGDGTKAARRFPLVDESGMPIRALQVARDVLDAVKAKRREGGLPQSGIKPPFADFAARYLQMPSTLAKKPGTQKNEAQAIARWKTHFGSTRFDRAHHPGHQGIHRITNAGLHSRRQEIRARVPADSQTRAHRLVQCPEGRR